MLLQDPTSRAVQVTGVLGLAAVVFGLYHLHGTSKNYYSASCLNSSVSPDSCSHGKLSRVNLQTGKTKVRLVRRGEGVIATMRQQQGREEGEQGPLALRKPLTRR